MAEFKKEISIAVAVAAALAIFLGGVAIYAFPNGTTLTQTSQSSTVGTSAETSSTTSITSETGSAVSITSRPAPCNAPGVQCGGMKIVYLSLTAPSTLNATSYSILNITVSNNSTGGLEIQSVQVYLNRTEVGNMKGPILVGDSATAAFQVPSTLIQVTRGSNYTLDVDSNAAGIEINVTAR